MKLSYFNHSSYLLELDHTSILLDYGSELTTDVFLPLLSLAGHYVCSVRVFSLRRCPRRNDRRGTTIVEGRWGSSDSQRPSPTSPQFFQTNQPSHARRTIPRTLEPPSLLHIFIPPPSPYGNSIRLQHWRIAEVTPAPSEPHKSNSGQWDGIKRQTCPRACHPEPGPTKQIRGGRETWQFPRVEIADRTEREERSYISGGAVSNNKQQQTGATRNKGGGVPAGQESATTKGGRNRGGESKMDDPGAIGRPIAVQGCDDPRGIGTPRLSDFPQLASD